MSFRSTAAIGRASPWQAIERARLRPPARSCCSWPWPCSRSSTPPSRQRGLQGRSRWRERCTGCAPLRVPGEGLGVPALSARRCSAARWPRRPRSRGAGPTGPVVLRSVRALVGAAALAIWTLARRRARRQGRGGARRAVDRREGAPRRGHHARPGPRSLPPGATVQVMDTTAGGIHALLRLGPAAAHALHLRLPLLPRYRRPAHRGAPGASSSRGSRPRRPAAVVMLERHAGPLRATIGSTRSPRCGELLDASYTLAVEGDGYRIYAKRSDS